MGALGGLCPPIRQAGVPPPSLCEAKATMQRLAYQGRPGGEQPTLVSRAGLEEHVDNPLAVQSAKQALRAAAEACGATSTCASPTWAETFHTLCNNSSAASSAASGTRRVRARLEWLDALVAILALRLARPDPPSVPDLQGAVQVALLHLGCPLQLRAEMPRGRDRALARLVAAWGCSSLADDATAAALLAQAAQGHEDDGDPPPHPPAGMPDVGMAALFLLASGDIPPPQQLQLVRPLQIPPPPDWGLRPQEPPDWGLRPQEPPDWGLRPQEPPDWGLRPQEPPDRGLRPQEPPPPPTAPPPQQPHNASWLPVRVLHPPLRCWR